MAVARAVDGRAWVGWADPCRVVVGCGARGACSPADAGLGAPPPTVVGVAVGWLDAATTGFAVGF